MSTESKKKPESSVEDVKDNQSATKQSEKKPEEKLAGQEDLKHILFGEVVSDKMDKTVVVLIERKVKHPVYGKYIRKSSRLFVHDENNQAVEGKMIKFKACKPYSKKKTWRLIEVL
jgi:small subunit ribosomal protein S17